jgi:hypothetical protein
MTDALAAGGCPPEQSRHDFADGVLDAAAAADVEAHLARCASCAREHDRLLSLRARARALSREVSPPPELWSAIETRIAPRAGAGDAWWRRPAMLAAAALVLMSLASAGTVLVMRARPAAVASVPAAASPAPPASLRAIDQGHREAIDELTRALENRRGELSPETVAAVERSLDIVDQALAEARAALAGDPGNATLTELVATAYRHKLTVLRRAAELEPRS